MYNFFAYIFKMKHIKRWGLMRNTQQENIKEHSADVAMIAHALALINNRLGEEYMNPERVMAIGLYHEAGEVITGDLATPIKYYNPQIKKAYNEIEKIAVKKLLAMLPPDLLDEYESILENSDEKIKTIVKAADKICAYIKCLEETKSGNREFEKAQATILEYITALKIPCVDYFMKNMAEGFSLTLDELN